MSRNPHTHAQRAALRARTRLAVCLLVGLLATPGASHAGQPYIWDQDDDHIDDRIETVHLLGYTYSFENADTLSRQRFEVERIAGLLAYGAYVVYDHPVTPADESALATIGLPVLHRIEEVPAIRTLGSFLQIQLAAARTGVERVEAVPLLYPMLHDNLGAIGARDPSEQVFPTWSGTGGPEGQGVVVAVLDGGVNDQAEASWPGHESLAGAFVGGALFTASDSTVDTGRDASFNPSDHGSGVTGGHGTHIAGIVLGSGGPSGFARGVAPAARLVDVKVLNETGSGSGLAEALDWCIHNAHRDWGVAGYEGIDVINLSLSSPDESDGNDLVSRLAAAAVQSGIVVVASMGNDGLDAHVPSPAAGDGVIAVGALDAQRTPRDEDDVFASFSNRGPRHTDGDADVADELKPDLLAPGVAVLSANGDETTDGHQYVRRTGTSMAAALVSGAAACLLSADPTLTPAAVAALLRETAWRGTAALPPGPSGSDPRWQAARGFGALDLYAAKLELEANGGSQLTRLELESGASTITARLRTQREMGAAFYALERAPDLAGAPGTWAAVDSAAAAGDGSLDDPVDRQVYTLTRNVPEPERGLPFWYRAAWTESGARNTTPARRYVSPSGPSAATLLVTIVHNAYDTDVDAAIQTGGGAVTFPLPGSSGAVSSDWVDGTSAIGNVAWSFRIEIPAGAADAWLPPASSAPWILRVAEGGLLNRSGRVTDYRLIQHTAGGDVTWTGGPTPLFTIEGQTVSAGIPQSTVGVGPSPVLMPGLRAGPNPVGSGASIRFTMPTCRTGGVEVIDLAGRCVARLPFTAGTGEECEALWNLRDAAGARVRPGVYVARERGGTVVRFVVLGR
jgi:subtilisin family serine protease